LRHAFARCGVPLRHAIAKSIPSQNLTESLGSISLPAHLHGLDFNWMLLQHIFVEIKGKLQERPFGAHLSGGRSWDHAWQSMGLAHRTGANLPWWASRYGIKRAFAHEEALTGLRLRGWEEGNLSNPFATFKVVRDQASQNIVVQNEV
jgi:hypothetical protein